MPPKSKEFMSEEATANGGVAVPAMNSNGHNARVIPCGITPRETIGCELAAEVLRTFGELRLQATGSSMLPAVWPGDILTVRSHAAAEPLPGDIVVFKRDGRLVTHRVVEVRDPKSEVRIPNPESRIPTPVPRIEFVTRGDRVRQNDAPISSHELLGRVVALKRGSRTLVPHRSPASRLASWILRHSDFATRVVVKCRI
jgi:hypothetical protein